MNLLNSTLQFLDRTEQFHQMHDAGNQYKMIALDCARKELEAIKGCAICEHPERIVKIWRLLTNTLPHLGYEEGVQLRAELEKILEQCRERLKARIN